jgi:hypothetical protein
MLFVALRGAEDPSRRRGRILSDDAGVRAIACLTARDANRYAGYEAVHVAYAGNREGERTDVARWVVLCDRHARTSLRDAVVVELRAEDGALLRLRKPVR